VRFFALEVTGMSIMSDFATSQDNTPLLASTRVVLGLEIVRGVTAIAGISENTTIAWGGRDLDIGSGFLESVTHDGTTTLRHYPGLLLGLQI
jgi:hypothetical protein